MSGNKLSSRTGWYMYVEGHVSVKCCPVISPLVPRPVKKGLATCNALPCPKEIQSVTQSHVNDCTHM